MNDKGEPLPVPWPKVTLGGCTRKEAVPCHSGSAFLDICLDFIKIFCLTILVAFGESLLKVNGFVFLMEGLI